METKPETYSIKLLHQTPIKANSIQWLQTTPDRDALIVWQEESADYFSTETLARIKSIPGKPRRYFDQYRRLLTSLPEGGFAVYSVKDASLCYTIPGVKDVPKAFSKNQFLIMKDEALLTSDGTHTKRWDKDGALLYQLEGVIYGYNNSNSKGDYFLLLSARDEFSVRRLDTGEQVGPARGAFGSVALSPDGKWLVSYGSWRSGAEVREVSTGAVRFTIPEKDTENIAFSDDGTSVFAWYSYVINISEDFGYSATEWELSTGKQRLSPKEPKVAPAPTAPTPVEKAPTPDWREYGSSIYAPDGTRTHLFSDELCWFEREGRRFLACIWREELSLYELCGPQP